MPKSNTNSRQSEFQSGVEFLRAIARKFEPISERIRSNERKIKLEFECPESLVPKMQELISSELERDARIQNIYRKAELQEARDYASGKLKLS